MIKGFLELAQNWSLILVINRKFACEIQYN